MTKKEVISLIRKRGRLAKELLDVCVEVDDYIREHDLEDVVEDEDWLFAAEIYSNPASTTDSLIKTIKENVK